MNKKKELLLLLALFVGMIASFDYVNRYHQEASKNTLAAIIEQNAVQPFSRPERSKFADCQVRGPLPDQDCSPGAIFPEATRTQICVKGYTKTVRNVSANLKKRIYQEYGLDYPQPTGSYEADHIIPLELGGSNDIANLFPEAAESSPTTVGLGEATQARPGFHEKDLVENYLNHEVCAGRLDLVAAQEQIATDWFTVYNNLTPEQINNLKQEFRN